MNNKTKARVYGLAVGRFLSLLVMVAMVAVFSYWFMGHLTGMGECYGVECVVRFMFFFWSFAFVCVYGCFEFDDILKEAGFL